MSESKEDWPPLVDIQQTFALYDAGEYDDFASAAVDHLETNEDLGRYHRIVLCCMMVDICAQANDREHYYAQAERQYEELKWYRFENDEDMYNDAGFLLKNAYDTMMRKLKEERQRDREETERLEWLEAEEINDDSDDPGSEDGDKTHALPVRTQALAVGNKPETARTQEADEVRNCSLTGTNSLPFVFSKADVRSLLETSRLNRMTVSRPRLTAE